MQQPDHGRYDDGEAEETPRKINLGPLGAEIGDLIGNKIGVIAAVLPFLNDLNDGASFRRNIIDAAEAIKQNAWDLRGKFPQTFRENPGLGNFLEALKDELQEIHVEMESEVSADNIAKFEVVVNLYRQASNVWSFLSESI